MSVRGLFRAVAAIVVMCALVAAGSLLLAAQSQPVPPGRQAQAKGVIEQGEDLEKKGDLDGALVLYENAAGTWQSKDTDTHIASVKTKIAARYLDKAAELYAAGLWQDAVAQIALAERFVENSPRVYYNYAACYYRMGQREKALEYLSRCELALESKSPERAKLAQLRSVIYTGETVADIPSESRETISNLDKLLSTGLEEKGESITDYREAEMDQEMARCKALNEASSRLPRTGTVFFNLAKCAQEDGRFEEARQYFAAYLKVAPDAMDGKEVQLSMGEIERMSAVGANAPELRKLYAEAYRLITVRKYGEAIQVYKKAEVLDPSFAQTKYKLGLLYDASGDVEMARQYLQAHIAAETNAEAKAPATAMLDTIVARHDLFDKKIQTARKDLMTGQYAPAEQVLRDALAVFPLSPEANSLLAYTFLNGNNPEAARRTMDVAWAFGYPVSFYAKVMDHQTGFTRSAKVEIEPDLVRIIYLTTPLPVPWTGPPQVTLGTMFGKGLKKAKTVPTSWSLTPSGSQGDKLANLGGSSRTYLRQDTPDVRVIPSGALVSVQTSGNVILLKAGRERGSLSDDLTIAPAVAFTPPDQGWPSRKFANTYARFFSQYLGFDGVKLGPEHMSFGEKAFLVMMVAAAAGGGFAAFENVSKVLAGLSAATAAYSALQNGLLQQRAMLQSLDFKLIPSEPMQLSFRTEDFK